MNKLDTFLKEHGTKLIVVLLLLTYFKGCGNKSELKYIKKELKATQEELIIQKEMIKDLPTSLDLQIEGLKSEHRAISASDRRVFDLKRQSEIIKEITELESK
tara:strand:- start:182 stop:490 length:309 start_codon:yes stop_codon:yes gene_type:complete